MKKNYNYNYRPPSNEKKKHLIPNPQKKPSDLSKNRT